MTNRERINSLPDDKLASMLIYLVEKETEEHDGCPYSCWVAMNGEEFENYISIFDPEIQWLKDRKED